jgi:hypothetical protein
MAVPTISAVSPSVGATGGGNLVQITGTNFRVWQIPAPTGGPAGPRTPTVEVRFNGARSSRVIVASATRLFAVVPKTSLPMVAPTLGEGVVAVEVRNVDSGVTIPGEAATLAGGYGYRRVQLALESDLTRLCRALMQELKAQVLANVSISTHTDWDPDTDDGLNTLGLAELPGIALLGPDLVENRFYSRNDRSWRQASGIEQVLRRAPYTVDLQFTLVGACELKMQAINLMAVVQSFVELTKRISMRRDGADPSQGYVSYDLDVMPDGDMRMDAMPSESNVHSFSGRLVLRGFDVEDLAGFPGSQVISRTAQVTEDVDLLVEQLVPQEEP